MLILNERNPKISLYYLGAKLLEFISNYDIERIRLFDLYERFNEIHHVAFNRFVLTLDWLFVLGKIKQHDDGALECI